MPLLMGKKVGDDIFASSEMNTNIPSIKFFSNGTAVVFVKPGAPNPLPFATHEDAVDFVRI